MKYTITYLNNGCKKVKTDDGVETWYDSEDLLHRADGPTIIFSYSDYDSDPNSETYMERKIFVRNIWFWHGKKIEAESQEHFRKLINFLPFL